MRFRPLQAENALGGAVADVRTLHLAQRGRREETEGFRRLLIRGVDSEHNVVVADCAQGVFQGIRIVYPAGGDYEIAPKVLTGRQLQLRGRSGRAGDSPGEGVAVVDASQVVGDAFAEVSDNDLQVRVAVQCAARDETQGV